MMNQKATDTNLNSEVIDKASHFLPKQEMYLTLQGKETLILSILCFMRQLTQVTETKFLCINFDTKLNLKEHFSLIEESLNERLKVIKTLTHDELVEAH